MAVLADARGSAQVTGHCRSTSVAQASIFESPAFAVLLGMLGVLALTWPKLIAVWQTGAFFDGDDAMHMVQVRDWLAGQGWFDLTAHRLDPPAGVFMHWSRILDVPVAGLVTLFQMFARPETAERLARIVYPVALQFMFFGAIVSVARRLVGSRGIAVATVLAAFSFSMADEFAPGRITHHSAQIILLVLMLGATLDVFDPRKAMSAALANGLASISLAISIENLPFIVLMNAVVVAAWIIRGNAMRTALLYLGAGLALGALAAFIVTVPPERYGDGVCDAFSATHLVAAGVAGTGFVVLGFASAALQTRAGRFAGGALVAAAAVVAVAATFPDCLGNPHAAVDPLVSRVWLANVNQARPLWTLLASPSLVWLPAVVPVVLGLAAALTTAGLETGDARARWLAVAGFVLIGVVGAFWEVRVLHSTAPIAILGGVWFFDRLLRLMERRARVLAAIPFLLASLFSPLPWSFAAARQSDHAAPGHGDPEVCFAPSAFRALDRLPPGLFLAPIDAGPYLLAFTHHSVLAAPYHRDNHGNHLAISAWLATADNARDLLRESAVRYVAICPAATELWIYQDPAPHGLAAVLRTDKAPGWLERVNIRETSYRIYRVR